MCPCTAIITPTTVGQHAIGPSTARTTDVRQLRAGEEHLVRQVFEGLSHDARFMRFHAPTPRLTSAALRALATVEDGSRGALVALADGGAVGLAQWARDPACARRAEMAMAVVDAHQGRGIGRALVTRLAEVLVHQGIQELVCLVHHENARVRGMLHRLGASRVPDGALVLPVAALNGEAGRTGVMLPWSDAVPGPRTPASGPTRRR